MLVHRSIQFPLIRVIFVSRTLKRQCHHNGAGVAGLSGAGRDDGFRLLLGAIAFV